MNLATAIAISADRHRKQVDKGGRPYILHPLKVMHYIRAEDDEDLQCIAVMHDLLEDTKTTFLELGVLGFSDRVIAALRALTRVAGQAEDEYLAAVSANPDAVRVKLADLRHNSDIRRLKGIGASDVERMKRYHAMYVALKEVARGLDNRRDRH